MIQTCQLLIQLLLGQAPVQLRFDWVVHVSGFEKRFDVNNCFHGPFSESRFEVEQRCVCNQGKGYEENAG